MALQTAADVSLLITVPSTTTPTSSSVSSPPLLSTERRLSPAWTIAQLKAKLEPITGIPPSAQRLRTKGFEGNWVQLGGSADDEETILVGDPRWRAGVRKGGEIEVVDTRPPSARPNYTDTSAVEKYTMPTTQYETLSDSVLAWKKRQRLGRFDPSAKSDAELAGERRDKDEAEISKRGLQAGSRCRVGGDDGRRGVIRFVGEILGLGGEREAGCRWIGVELDEPIGKNDGSVVVESVVDEEEPEGAKPKKQHVWRVFECRDKFGVFVRPEKVEAGGEWVPLDDLEIDEDMEEL